MIWAQLASFAAVIRGALRDEMKRIQEKGAFHYTRLSAFEPAMTPNANYNFKLACVAGGLLGEGEKAA